jgi:hypothetical protein
MATYAIYLALCHAHGIRPLSYVAWANLMPLSEAEF